MKYFTIIVYLIIYLVIMGYMMNVAYSGTVLVCNEKGQCEIVITIGNGGQ